MVIFYPVFAMVVLVMCVIIRLGILRYRAVTANPKLFGFYVDYRGEMEPQAIRIVSRHLVNQFEMPMLFYLGAIVAYVTGQVSPSLLGLAWLYVGLRYLHSFVHLGKNVVFTRFRLFAASCLALMVFWAVLMVSIISAATAPV